MIKIIYTWCFLLLTIGGLAQTDNKSNVDKKQFRYVVGYYGFKFTNPGVQIGIENQLAASKKFESIASLLLQVYTEKGKQTGLKLNLRWGQRYTTNFGLLIEGHFGIGPEFTTYFADEVNFLTGTSVIKKESKIGVSPNMALGLGYDFNRKTNLPMLCFVRPNISWLLPDRNLVFQTSINLEVGLVFSSSLFKKQP